MRGVVPYIDRILIQIAPTTISLPLLKALGTLAQAPSFGVLTLQLNLGLGLEGMDSDPP